MLLLLLLLLLLFYSRLGTRLVCLLMVAVTQCFPCFPVLFVSLLQLSSHQCFHFFVVAAAVYHYSTVMMQFEWRKAHTCAA